MTPDYYYAPALILTALLLPVFGHLYRRFRDTRSLLWFLGYLLALVAMVLLYPIGGREAFAQHSPWIAAAGRAAIQVSAALFLASLSPLSFRMGRFRVLYVVPYAAPLVAAAILHYGLFRGAPAHGPALPILTALGAIALIAALFWAAARGTVPLWLGLLFTVAAGGAVLWIGFTRGAGPAMVMVECANLLLAALMVLCVFRRFSPGVALSVIGLGAWSLAAVRILSGITHHTFADLVLMRVIVMGKVVAAMGMIVLTIEDQVAANKAAEERERRARRELEAYTKLMLGRRRVEDFDRQAAEICETIVAHSRFRQAALLLHSAGRYRLAGWAGLDAATAKGMSDLAARIPATGFLAEGSAPPALDQSHTVVLDLRPWMWPGDNLKRLGFASVLAVPMMNRSATEGALLLSGIRPEPGSSGRRTDEDADGLAAHGPRTGGLRTDDLLPIEMFTARLQATRSQTMTLERLIDSEKFAHLGQMAASVTQQLNSPLTVILGYASLLEQTGKLDAQDRKGVESILAESRRMRTTLESLARIAQAQGDEMAAVSVSELLSDLGELHRAEFLERSIELRLSIAPALPRVLCSAPQLRQAVRHCLRFAMEAVESAEAAPDEPKTVRLEAASAGSVVQILVAHSGPGFVAPERAFDPFIEPQPGLESAANLSLCATILRNNNGRATAVNLEPRGAAIILELPAA